MKFRIRQVEPEETREPEWPFPVTIEVVFRDRGGRRVAAYAPGVAITDYGQTVSLSNLRLERVR